MVAEAMEALARLAPSRPVRSLHQATHADALRAARTCYDHLAGRLGVALTDALVATGLVGVETGGPGDHDPVLGAGRARRYAVTEAGRDHLGSLGVMLDGPGRRPLVRYCVDWSEQRPHLGGRLGATLLEMLLACDWVRREDRRVVHVTAAGRAGLRDQLGVDASVLA